jgi:hypothetical protein
MDNPGVYTLSLMQIGAAKSSLLTAIPNLSGMSAVTLEASFVYGAGGTTCSAIVVTSFDGGTTWFQIARFDFTTANGTKVANLSGLLSKAVGACPDLASEGVNDGVLGDQLAALIVSTGNYTGQTYMNVRASVR